MNDLVPLLGIGVLSAACTVLGWTLHEWWDDRDGDDW